jgi:Phage tail sheath protein FI
LELVSNYIRVDDDTTVLGPPANGTYTLVGGSDGVPSDPEAQDELLIGTLAGYTGIYAISDPEQYDIDLVAVPGHSSTDVIMAMIDMCQNIRMDCMAIVDPPFGLTVTEIVHWQNGTHPLNLTRFDTDFAALYWPWVKIRDTYNKIDIWVPPSGSIMAMFARSDSIGEPWNAPAGATRGIVSGITDVYSRPTRDERDDMYGNRNCVNPIIQFNDLQNYTVWGQKTLQRAPTALDRVNVRRLMFVIEKRIKNACKVLLFEPHDEKFHQRFISIAKSILEEIKTASGIYDYIIKADWELNTPDVVDRNEFRAQIGIQPVKAVEFIFIEFSLHRKDSWTENTEQPYTS